MTTLQQALNDVELELHTLETATPRNSATVDRGELRVVDEGSVILRAGGTMFFGEGGSAVSSDYSLPDRTGWQIGTERRGTAVVVLNDTPGTDLEVTTADSSVEYEEISLSVEEPTEIELGEFSALIVQVFDVVPEAGNLSVGDAQIMPTQVYKSRKLQYAYSYMDTLTEGTVIVTDIPNLIVRVARLSVNNAS